MRIGLLLALWSFAFACVHVAWALGWRGGVPADLAPISDRPWFLAYDVVAGLLMYAAAAGALLLAVGRGGRLLRRTAVVASVLALLRGVPALVIDIATRNDSLVSVGADVWFVVAGIAGLALARLSAVPAHTATEGEPQRRAVGG